MTVYEFCELYINGSEEMEIWHNEEEKTVFRGTFNGAAYSDFCFEEITSFGIENGIIVVNIG